ncbi:Kinesin, motor domain-containing protein [Cynara cardunculus var. scolymus]|uniref:Kinesin, motor domain-containing protein n=1 Tax=Cynara cardunculus var. scolymus TaxID=59895 RepID=A0A103YLC6_CYNCS|nr:Kinesin, motor domain-containing protein [Cynara cardunculus var. scolymus]
MLLPNTTTEAENVDYGMKVTFLELYNDETIDLLAAKDYSTGSKLEADLARRAEHYFSENMRVIKGFKQV